MSDFENVGTNMHDGFEYAKKRYFQETPLKLSLLDNLILLSLATFVIQAVYGVVFNRDPFNSFIAGCFCSLGTFTMSTSLRMQISQSEFDH